MNWEHWNKRWWFHSTWDDPSESSSCPLSRWTPVRRPTVEAWRMLLWLTAGSKKLFHVSHRRSQKCWWWGFVFLRMPLPWTNRWICPLVLHIAINGAHCKSNELTVNLSVHPSNNVELVEYHDVQLHISSQWRSTFMLYTKRCLIVGTDAVMLMNLYCVSIARGELTSRGNL